MNQPNFKQGRILVSIRICYWIPLIPSPSTPPPIHQKITQRVFLSSAHVCKVCGIVRIFAASDENINFSSNLNWILIYTCRITWHYCRRMILQTCSDNIFENGNKSFVLSQSWYEYKYFLWGVWGQFAPPPGHATNLFGLIV